MQNLLVVSIKALHTWSCPRKLRLRAEFYSVGPRPHRQATPAFALAAEVGVLWVDVDSGETHEGVLKARYGDQIPPDVEPVTVSWKPQAYSI